MPVASLGAARSQLLLHIQPLADVHKPGGDKGSLPRDLRVTLCLVESEGAQVAASYVQSYGLLVRIPGQVFCRRKQASGHPLAPERGGDHQPLDVGLRGDGGVCRVREQGRRPYRAGDAEVASQSLPQTAGEHVLPGRCDPHADTAGDLPIGVPFDHQRSHPTRDVLQGDPFLHDLDGAVHSASEDVPELVQEPFHDEGRDSLVVIRPGQANGELLGLHRAILPESRPSADEPPAHDLDGDEGQRDGEDEHPRDVDDYAGRGTRREFPAHVDGVVERGEPGDLRDWRGDGINLEEDAREQKQRCNDQGKVVRVEVYAFYKAGKERAHHAEHDADHQQHQGQKQGPPRGDERLTEHDPENQYHREERSAVERGARPRPQILPTNHILGVDRRGYYGVVYLVDLELDEGVESALEGGCEHGVARQQPWRHELDVGLAVDAPLLDERPEPEPEGRQVEERLDEVGEQNGLPVLPEYSDVTLPYPERPTRRGYPDRIHYSTNLLPVSRRKTSSRPACR